MENDVELDYLTRCNNCYSILIDENPQTDAVKMQIPNNAKAMVRSEDEDGEFWACPVCETDEYLATSFTNNE